MEHVTSFQEGILQEVEIVGLPNLNISRENLDTLGRIWIKLATSPSRSKQIYKKTIVKLRENEKVVQGLLKLRICTHQKQVKKIES